MYHLVFPGGVSGKEPACQCRRHERHGFGPWGQKDSLEKQIETHSSIHAWKIPWTDENPMADYSPWYHKSQTQLK